jgi:hypothetical protein
VLNLPAAFSILTVVRMPAEYGRIAHVITNGGGTAIEYCQPRNRTIRTRANQQFETEVGSAQQSFSHRR